MEGYFHTSPYIKLARALTLSNNDDMVPKLLSYCPKPTENGCFILTGKHQSAILSLGLYLVESELKVKSSILDYLLLVQSKLHKSKILMDHNEIIVSDLPVAENFAYCLTSILSEISALDLSEGHKVSGILVESLISHFNLLDNVINGDLNEGQLHIFNTQTYPVLLGILRGIGRVSYTIIGIISQLFPPGIDKRLKSNEFENVHDIKIKINAPVQLNKTLPPTSSRLERLAATLSCSVPDSCEKCAIKDSSTFNPITGTNMKQSGLDQQSLTLEQHKFYFSVVEDFRKNLLDKNLSRHDQCFNQNPWFNTGGSEYLLNELCSVYGSKVPHRFMIDLSRDGENRSIYGMLIFTSAQLKELFSMLKKVINKNFTVKLDEICTNYISGRKTFYPYRTYSHPLKLSILMLIHDCLNNKYQKIPEQKHSSLLQMMKEIFTQSSAELSHYNTELLKNPVGSPNIPIIQTPRIDTNTNNQSAQSVETPSNLPQTKNNFFLHSSFDKLTVNGGSPGISNKFHSPNLNSSNKHNKHIMDQSHESDLLFKYNLTNSCISMVLYIHTKCTTDVNNAESLMNRLTERIQSVDSRKHLIGSNAGVLLTCLECCAQLTHLFPHLAKSNLDTLSDFLLVPNQILSFLNRQRLKHTVAAHQQQHKINPNDTIKSLHKIDLSSMKPKDKIKYMRYTMIFEKIRDSAIMSLCLILTTDNSLIQNFLADLSRRFFNAVESDSAHSKMGFWKKFTQDTTLMYFNTVFTLGKMGVLLKDVSDTQEAVLQFYQQSLQLSNLPSLLGQKIIEQLGFMIIASSKSVYQQIMTIFTDIRIKSMRSYSIQSECKELHYSDLSKSVEETFGVIAANIHGNDALLDMIGRLLDHFIHLELETRRSVKTSVKTSIKGAFGFMIPVIATLMKRLSHFESDKRLQKKFREFWLYLVIMNFTASEESESYKYFKDVCTIAAHAPTILSNQSLSYELENNSEFLSLNLNQSEVHEMKSKIIELLGNSAEVAPLVTRMGINQISYLKSVYHLELLCSQNSQNAEAIHRIFHYLEDTSIMKDKLGLWTCIIQIGYKVFENYLKFMKENKELNVFREKTIDMHAQFLLVKFNHHQKQIRIIADHFLSELAKSFPHIIWSGKVLHTMLDITQLLSLGLEVDSNKAPPVFDVPSTNFRLQIVDSQPIREEILNDFVKNCKSILEVGIQWVPNVVRSHLIQYILRLESIGHQHIGLAIATQAILMHVGYNRIGTVTTVGNTASLPSGIGLSSLGSLKAGTSTDTSSFMSNLNLRSRYLGEVHGMLDTCENKSVLFERLITDLKSACRKAEELCHSFPQLNSLDVNNNDNNNNTTSAELSSKEQSQLISHKQLSQNRRQYKFELNRIQVSLFRICGMMVLQTNPPSRRLLHELCWTPTYHFTQSVMEGAVDCWNWLLAAKPDIVLTFLCEMASAWQKTIDSRMGVFAEDPKEYSPLIVGEDYKMKPHMSNVNPHKMWTKFLQERLYVAQESNAQQAQILSGLIHRSLNPTSHLSRSVTSVGVRFRLLTMGLSTLQHIYQPSNKTLLREKLYLATLDYFANPPRFPAGTQRSMELKEDINSIFQFWMVMRNEKKYLVDYSSGNCSPDLRSLDFFPGCSNGSGINLGSGGILDSSSVILSGQSNGFITNTGFLWSSNANSPNISTGNPNINQSTPPVMNNRSGVAPANMLRLYSTPADMGNINGGPSVNNGLAVHNGLSVSSAASVASTKKSTLGKRSNTIHTVDGSMTQTYFRKRTLILALLAVEIDRLSTWNNPLDRPELAIPQLNEVNLWYKDKQVRDKYWADYARLAWIISPELAINLPDRFRSSETLVEEICRLVRTSPNSVCHIPDALKFLATPSNIENDISELIYILMWAPVAPVVALSFFSRMYPQHPLTHQYAVKVLSSYPSDTLIFYVPQIVQGLRYDKIGYLTEFIMEIVATSPVLAHQLIWNMKTNTFKDEEATIKDPDIGNQLETLVEEIEKSFSGTSLQFSKREFDFFDKITNVSGIIRPFPKGPQRKQACLEALEKIQLQEGCYLPSNPDSIVLEIDYTSGTPLQSAAKAPYLARFKVKQCGVQELEKEATKMATVGLLQSNGDPNKQKSQSNKPVKSADDNKKTEKDIYWQACIFKVGDDVRQDILALQVIRLFKNILEREGIPHFLYPYRVVATGPGCGVIECVPDSKSRDQIGRQTDGDLFDYFSCQFGEPTSAKFQKARRNFVISMASYSVICYLLQIKDRHNGNIMVDKHGHIIHIDFGFMFESSPGNNMGFEPDIKLTREMMAIMGGNNPKTVVATNPSSTTGTGIVPSSSIPDTSSSAQDVSTSGANAASSSGSTGPTTFANTSGNEYSQYQWFEQLSIQAFLALRPYQEPIVALISLMLDSGLPCFRGQTIKLLRARFVPNLSDKEAAAHYIRMVRACCDHWRANAYDYIQFVQNQIPY